MKHRNLSKRELARRIKGKTINEALYTATCAGFGCNVVYDAKTLPQPEKGVIVIGISDSNIVTRTR